jgi:aspartyl-tRNA(Asn)/glutamyl-tRNA(Gln) amidotransferase subunit B
MEIGRKSIPQRIRDERALYPFVREALNENPMSIIEYKQGKQSAFNFLVSQAMKKTKGYGDPLVIRRILKKML